MQQQLGRYTLLKRIASGGMADVFLGRASGPDGFHKTLVIKRILPHLAEEPGFVAMFRNEARLAAQLNHPNLVQVFDFGEADGFPFLAMELVDGPTLRQLVGSPPRLVSPVLAARIAAEAARGLSYAHDLADATTGEPLGLVHRDVSPDNILISRSGSVKVVDFGIARALGQGHQTRTGTVKGRLAYMPPEQLRAEPLDRRVDVFALGVVLYELCTGARPYDLKPEQEGHDAATLEAILFKPLIPALRRKPDLPAPLAAILERALLKDRAQRTPNARTLCAELERFIASCPEPASTFELEDLVSTWLPGTGLERTPAALKATPTASEATAAIHTPAKPSPRGTPTSTNRRLVVVRPYAPHIRSRVASVLTQLGYDFDQALVLPAGSTDADVVEALRLIAPPHLLLVPFNAQRDRAGQLVDGLSVINALHRDLPAFVRVPLLVPISRMGLSGWTIRRNQVPLHREATLLPVQEDELDQPEPLVRRLREAGL